MLDFVNKSWHLYDDTVIIYKENSNDSIKFCHKCSKVIHDYLIGCEDKFTQARNYSMSTDVVNKIIGDLIKMLPGSFTHPCSYIGIIFKEYTLCIKSRSNEMYYFINEAKVH